MKKHLATAPFSLFAILVAVLVSTPVVSAQQGGGSGTNQHRISAMSQPAQPSQATATEQQVLWWCTFTVGLGTGQATDYVNDNLVQADSMSTFPLNHAWSAYIRATYPIPASVLYGRCDVVSTTAPGGPQRFITQTEQTWKASGHNVVHVNWTYTPQAQASPGAAQTSGTATYIYCASDVGTSPVYFSEIFSVDVPPETHSVHSSHQAVFDKVTADFLAFIRKKYSYKTNSNYPAGCPNYGAGPTALSAAEDTKKKLQEQARASNLSVVETGWNYNSPPSSAPVAGAAPAPPPASAASPAPATSRALAAHPAPVNTTPGAAAPAAPPPAVAAPAGKAYRCAFGFHQGTQSMRYVAGPIVTEAAQPALTEAWRNYISSTYHPTHPQGQGGCTVIPGKPANWDKAVSAFEANSNQLGVHTTHVNWTSVPKR